MPRQIIKQGTLIENEWTSIGAEDQIPLEGKVLVHLEAFVENKDVLLARGDLGLIVTGETPLEDIQGFAKQLPVIAISFPAFTDGRGYTLARELREKLGYEGELRAVGDVLQDQLFYLSRVGFNAFDIAEHQDPASAIEGLQDFTVKYQAANDEPLPIYRRR